MRARVLAFAFALAVSALAQQSPSPIAPPRLPQSIGPGPQSIGPSPQSIGRSPRSIGPAPPSLPSLSAAPQRPREHKDHTGALGFYPVFAAAPSYAEPVVPVDSAPQDQTALSDHLRELSEQIRDLQKQLAQNATPQPAEPATAQDTTAPATPAITVVLKNGKSFQTQSYAVVGDAFWDLSTEPARKLPLSAIDLPASKTLSESNGAEFPAILSR